VKGVPHMGPHALRRTYGMQLLEAGVDVVTAADLMRHDAKMLLEEYARSRPDLKIAAIARTFGEQVGTTVGLTESAS
jgi:integrase